MENTQIRATKQLTERLKAVIKVRGQKESMATLIDNMLEEETKKYTLTQDGYARVGDTLKLADKDRQLTDEVVKILIISNEDVLLSNNISIQRNGRISYFSRVIK